MDILVYIVRALFAGLALYEITVLVCVFIIRNVPGSRGLMCEIFGIDDVEFALSLPAIKAYMYPIAWFTLFVSICAYISLFY